MSRAHGSRDGWLEGIAGGTLEAFSASGLVRHTPRAARSNVGRVLLSRPGDRGSKEQDPPYVRALGHTRLRAARYGGQAPPSSRTGTYPVGVCGISRRKADCVSGLQVVVPRSGEGHRLPCTLAPRLRPTGYGAAGLSLRTARKHTPEACILCSFNADCLKIQLSDGRGKYRKGVVV